MYLIIGGSSFIGVYLAEEFKKQGVKFAVTLRNKKFEQYYSSLGVDCYDLDLTQKEDFDKLPTRDITGVVLLAGLLPANVAVNIDKDENAADYFSINTIGTINVLEYCRINRIPRVISTTSYADVFKAWSANIAITETEPRAFNFIGDHAVYVISKNAASDVMEYYNEQHGMLNAVFRLPPVYGVGPHGSIYVNGKYLKSGLQIFIERAIMGQPITIFGNRNLSRDVVYVKDVAHAFYLALKSPKTKGLYNMTSGKGITLQQEAEIIAEVFENKNGRSKIEFDASRKNNTPSFLFSMEKAKQDFSFIPEFSDFRKMMLDYKKDMEANKFQELFKK